MPGSVSIYLLTTLELKSVLIMATRVGWGVGRHPCLGMRFAKLEINIIVAFFLAYFDEITLSDEQGRPTDKIPPVNRNRHTAHKPDEHIYLKYKVRKDDSVA